MGRFIDLRPASEQEMEARARRPLDGPDEAIAQQLATLVQRTDREYDADRAAYQRTVDEIRKIGEELCAAGGDDRMKQVAYRMAALGGRIRTLEMHWDGVCGWMW